MCIFGDTGKCGKSDLIFLTGKENIRKFFNDCIIENGWKLKEKIDNKVSYLVDYIKNELSVYLKEQKGYLLNLMIQKKMLV